MEHTDEFLGNRMVTRLQEPISDQTLDILENVTHVEVREHG